MIKGTLTAVILVAAYFWAVSIFTDKQDMADCMAVNSQSTCFEVLK